jgi:hypothetical protein
MGAEGCVLTCVLVLHCSPALILRPLDTIVMDPRLKSYIVEDAKEFFASESWYAERGLPFRRGVSSRPIYTSLLICKLILVYMDS